MTTQIFFFSIEKISSGLINQEHVIFVYIKDLKYNNYYIGIRCLKSESMATILNLLLQFLDLFMIAYMLKYIFIFCTLI